MPFSIIKPDSEEQSYEDSNTTIFLAGSIDNGKATLWSQDVYAALAHLDYVTLFNPRRDVWQPEIEQRARNDVFRDQVEWELYHLRGCDIPFFYFEAGSVSPITLQELGYVCGLDRHRHRPIVCCPDRFWRKGNVEIMCSHHNIEVHNDIDQGIMALKEAIAVDRRSRRLLP